MSEPRNVLGGPLKPCCGESLQDGREQSLQDGRERHLHNGRKRPITGFFRDGFCRTIEEDRGSHVVCAVVTRDFLEFTRSRGNDLITPRPEFDFPGLQPGDAWCLCALRWKEAWEAGVAPAVKLESTHEKALDFIPLSALKEHALH